MFLFSNLGEFAKVINQFALHVAYRLVVSSFLS